MGQFGQAAAAPMAAGMAAGMACKVAAGSGLAEWLTKQGLDATKMVPLLEAIGVDDLRELLTLGPEEIEELPHLQLQHKHRLASAIGATIDLTAWLQEWGLAALASSLEAEGIETPEDMLDLAPAEIERLPVRLVEKLQLTKAVAHLDMEHAALQERSRLLREREAAASCALAPRQGSSDAEATRVRSDSPGTESGPRTWSGTRSCSVSAGIYGLPGTSASTARKSLIGASRPPSRSGAAKAVGGPVGTGIGKRRIGRGGDAGRPPRHPGKRRAAPHARVLLSAECPF